MVTRKICPELFFISVFDPRISIEGNFLDRFLGCVRSTYTQVNTVMKDDEKQDKRKEKG